MAVGDVVLVSFNWGDIDPPDGTEFEVRPPQGERWKVKLYHSGRLSSASTDSQLHTTNDGGTTWVNTSDAASNGMVLFLDNTNYIKFVKRASLQVLITGVKY